MAKAPQTFRCRPVRSKAERDREADQRRGSSRERGYTGAWERASKARLARHPLCEYCALDGCVTPATLTDHLYPHQGDRDLFWRSEWWVSSCDSCHSGMKQAAERQGKSALDTLAHLLRRTPRG